MKIQEKKFLVVLVLFALCSQLNAQNLKETTESFTKIFTQTTLSSEQFAAKLKPFIDPAANADSICLDYYTHWKHCSDQDFYPLETTIEEIKREGKNTATVLISNIWHCDTGQSYYFLSHTNWVKKENKWYRSTKEAKILASNLIETTNQE